MLKHLRIWPLIKFIITIWGEHILHCDLRRLWIQMEIPSHSLHCVLRRWWIQMEAPPHSLHCALRRWWIQTELPSHSLQFDLSRLWIQIEPPSHSLHRVLTRLWIQMEPPSHSLHADLALPWSHCNPILLSLHAIHVFRRIFLYTSKSVSSFNCLHPRHRCIVYYRMYKPIPFQFFHVFQTFSAIFSRFFQKKSTKSFYVLESAKDWVILYTSL